MTRRFTSQRDIDNKLVGSIIYCPKEDDYFYVTGSLNSSSVSCVEFKHEDTRKNKKLALNVEYPDHISLKSFFPGFINLGEQTAYWFRRGRKSWHYGYAGSHASYRNNVLSAMAPLHFIACVVTPEGYDALRGVYPDRDEALWIAKHDDPTTTGRIVARAWSKHMAFAKDFKGKILILVNGIQCGHTKKDGTLVVPRLKREESLPVFKKVLRSVPFEPSCKRTVCRLEGDEPDFATERSIPKRELDDRLAFARYIRTDDQGRVHLEMPPLEEIPID